LTIALGLLWVAKIYKTIQGPNVILEDEQKEIFVPTGSTFEGLTRLLTAQKIINDEKGFRDVAKWMKFSDLNVKAGKYILNSGMSNRQLISLVRSGKQTPVMVTINQVRKVEEVGKKIADQLEPDSAAFATWIMNPSFLKENGYTKENILSLFIPNTYEMYWNSSPEVIAKRMKKEHQNFWSKNNRLDKAEKWGLSPHEVYTLASILERESQSLSERPTIAGLYLNRLERGIPLQADPTVVFAVGDFTLRRVLNKHLEIDSPYNTYRFAGLPPGPICMPSISSLDAVLNAEKHRYLYMCARPDNSGLHSFAETLSAHNVNANRYRRWLNQRGIR
jgi:UPF0755 protein